MWTQGWQDAKEKQGLFPKAEAVALRGTGDSLETRTRTLGSLCLLPDCLFHDSGKPLSTLPPLALYPLGSECPPPKRGGGYVLSSVPPTTAAVSYGLMSRGVS